ncbi:MAG: TRAP transporter permease [Anaerolineae bacterium]
MREFRGYGAVVLGALYAAFVGWSLAAAVRPIETYFFRMVHLAFILTLGFLAFPPRKDAPRWTQWLDLVLALLGIGAVAWGARDIDTFVRRSTVPDPADLVFGVLTILLLLELSRRVVGGVFTGVVAFFLFYCYFGYLFPSAIAHKGYGLDRIVGHMYMSLEGILGVPLNVSASFVILFVVYGTLMDAAGAGQFWLDLALATMGRKSSSAGRGAIITTALLGGPQASGVATTMSVAPLMWPILQKAGYDPDRAAGLISAGGIGAVISPPLMGAAAFLIMQFLGVSFWNVVVMVIIPTLLYYLGTFFMVEMEAQRHNFAPPDVELKKVGQVLRERGYHLISLTVLIVLLALGRSPGAAAIYAILTVVVTSFLSRDRREWLTPRRLVEALIEGAKNMVPVAVLLAAAGLIVGTFSLTGLGLKVSGLILSLSKGSVLATLFLSLAASMIIGLSLPITATYIMTVIMIAPALVKVGVPDYVAHLLAFYFAVLSEVSPPVGLSPSAAAAVTGGNPFKAMMHAWKYSLPAFLVPFFFASTKEGTSLLLIGANVVDCALALTTAVVSLFFLALGIVGFFRGKLPLVERILLIAAALAMIVTPLSTESFWGVLPPVLGFASLVGTSWVSRKQRKEGAV